MAFKLPSLRRIADDPAAFVMKDMPSFIWSDLTDKEEIGQGAFGSVFMARHPAAVNGDHYVVIKKLLGTGEAARRLFVKEAKLLHRLRDRNVVQFKAICFTPMAIMLEYLCFDFSPFGNSDKVNSLDGFLNYVDRHDAFGEFNFQQKLAKDISSGIAYLHEQGVAHRDLKPANILVSNSHYSKLCDQEELHEVFKAEPIVCKLTDFGESRSPATQTSTICHTATQNVQRGSPAFMAPEIFSGNRLPTAATVEDLKAVDMWALGMVLFMLLNPNLKHPFEAELRVCNSGLTWQAVIEAMFEKKTLPGHDRKYEVYQATDWLVISEAFKKSTKFIPSERPTSAEIAKFLSGENGAPTCQDIPLKVSQASAVAHFDRSVLAAGGQLRKEAVPIPNDATNGCAFLCLEVADIIIQELDCSAEDQWETTASLLEEVILTSPESFNQLRNVREFYDVMEAYQLLKEGGLISSYTISEEMVTPHRVFCEEGRSSLLSAVKSLRYEDTKIRIGLYTCGGYIILIGCTSGRDFFLIDTHPVSSELGGNGNGLLKVFPGTDANSAMQLCSWLWKRLRLSGVGADQMQSFSVLEHIPRSLCDERLSDESKGGEGPTVPPDFRDSIEVYSDIQSDGSKLSGDGSEIEIQHFDVITPVLSPDSEVEVSH